MSLKAFEELALASDHLGLPKPLYDEFYSICNQAIKEYNLAILSHDKAQRIRSLKKMQLAFEAVDLKCPPISMTHITPYFHKKSDFFLSIQEAFMEEGISDPLMLHTLPSHMAKMLTRLPYDKCQSLYNILKEQTECELLMTQLQILFGEEYNPDSKEWRQFLMSHSIAYLGGVNGKSFRVRSLLDNQEVVLKIDNRLKMPRHIEGYLRNKMPHLFLPVYAAKHIEVMNEAEQLSEVRTLLVTDLCMGSLETHSQLARLKSRFERNIAAVIMMQQMTQALIEIEAYNTCFLDAKLSNWLVDFQGNIRVADTKSFLYTFQGQLYPDIPGNEYGRFISTEHYRPSYSKNDIDVEAWHASILGRNLYVYLTNHEPPESPNDFNYTYLAFTEKGGDELKTLIQALVREPENLRMSLKDALVKLQALEIKLDSTYNNIFTHAKVLSRRCRLDVESVFLETIQNAMRLPNFDKNLMLESSSILLKIIEDTYEICRSKMDIITKKSFKGISLCSVEGLKSYMISKLKRCTNITSFSEGLRQFSTELDEFIGAYDTLQQYEKCQENLKSLNLSKRMYDELTHMLDDRISQNHNLRNMALVHNCFCKFKPT